MRDTIRCGSRALAVMVFVVCAFALVGCSCSPDGGSPDGGTDGAGAPPSYLRLELPEKDVDLDPSVLWESASITVHSALYSPLFRLGPDNRVEPDLAAAIPIVSGDGRILKVTLRENAYFHRDPCFLESPQGRTRKVTAADVVFTILRVADPANEQGPWPVLQGRIVGLDAHRAALAADPPAPPPTVEGIRALSPHEVEFRLARPDPTFLFILTMPSLGIVPHEAVRTYGKQLSRHPVGSGPFRCVSWASNRVIMQAVPDHWWFVGRQGTPAGLVFDFHDDTWDAFRTGALDQVTIRPRNWFAYVTPTGVIKPDLAAAGYRVHRMQQLYTRFLTFNYRNPLFADVHIRRAIRAAVDWSRIIEPQQILSASLVPRGLPGFLPLEHRRDLDAARRDLAAAGYPDGEGFPPLVIRYRWFDRDLRDGAMVQDDLAEIGIKSRLVYTEGKAMDNVDLGFLGWVLDVPDGANVLEIFHSASAPPNGWNFGRYSSPAYDALLAEAAATPFAAARGAVYERANRFLYDECVTVPFAAADELHALSPRVTAFVVDPMGYPVWSEVRTR